MSERLKNYQTTTSREEQTLIIRLMPLNAVRLSVRPGLTNLIAQEILAEAERKEAAVTERSDVLDITYSQADATLKNHGIEMPASIKDAEGNDPVKIGYLFKQALSLIHELGATQTKSGNFFLESGKQTQGTLIHLGNIEAFGISEEGSGSLVPAGGGDYKLWKGSGAESAIALSKNQQPDLLQLFLFESRTNSIEETREKTLIGIIDSGGPIGWVIVILGVFAVFLVLIRAYLLKSNSANTKQLSDQIIHQLAEGDLDDARKSCEDNSSAISRVLSYTLRHLKDDQRNHMEGIVYEAILQENATTRTDSDQPFW